MGWAFLERFCFPYFCSQQRPSGQVDWLSPLPPPWTDCIPSYSLLMFSTCIAYIYRNHSKCLSNMNWLNVRLIWPIFKICIHNRLSVKFIGIFSMIEDKVKLGKESRTSPTCWANSSRQGNVMWGPACGAICLSTWLVRGPSVARPANRPSLDRVGIEKKTRGEMSLMESIGGKSARHDLLEKMGRGPAPFFFEVVSRSSSQNRAPEQKKSFAARI